MREALRIRRQRLGDSHPSVATTLANLAMCLQRQGMHEQAEQHLRDALEIQRACLGDQHPDLGMDARQPGHDLV